MTSATSPKPRRFRPDIQALRAVAILAVLVYHLWPTALPGGFLGVDLFFVISGFLITSHLLRDTADGTLDLRRFWARRIRRLLPAAFLVLAVTTVLVFAFSSMRAWDRDLGEIVASALYVENWFLAANSVDYLAEDGAVSPVQHFWSLSTEEQFYVIWPVLIALTLLVLGRLARHRASFGSEQTRRRALASVLGVVTVASLVTAITMTAIDPEPSYFVTPTRAWEFGVGSLLAFLPAAALSRFGRWAAPAASWLGWTIIGVSIAVFSSAIPHPSWPTVIPIVGIALVLLAGRGEARVDPMFVGRARPVQWLGDVSYSLYLWHWPLIVFAPALFGEIDVLLGLLIAAVALVLAALTYYGVELRTQKLALEHRGRTRRWFAVALAGALVLAIAPTAGLGARETAIAGELETARAYVDENLDCAGAVSVRNDACDEETDTEPVPGVLAARDDREPITEDCLNERLDAELNPCAIDYGDAATVVVIGDSHAYQLMPLVEGLGASREWDITLLAKSSCPFTDATRVMVEVEQQNCTDWNDAATDWLIEQDPDLVIVGGSSAQSFVHADGTTSLEAAAAGLESRWTTVLEQTDAQLVAVRDNPLYTGALACLEESTEQGADCVADPAQVIQTDPQVLAAADIENERMHLVSFLDIMCTEFECPAVIGGVTVYRDLGHLTASFVSTLLPLAEERWPAEVLAVGASDSDG